MTSFPAALRAWVEQLPERLFSHVDDVGIWHDWEQDKAELLARLDVFATEWEAKQQEQQQPDSEDEITRLKKQLAAGDAARAALLGWMQTTFGIDEVGDEPDDVLILAKDYLVRLVSARAALREQIQALSDSWCREPVTHNGEAWARGKCVDELRKVLASSPPERTT